MTKFGKFRLLERIGAGGMAEVFLAKPTDASLSKLLAVKRILPAHASDAKFLEMFKREGAIAMQLRHMAIIAVHEMGSIDGQYYLSMEYFPGQPLSVLIRKLREAKVELDPAIKALIVKNVAEALHYVHEFRDFGDVSEIIHRDVNPGNIMIGYDGVTKLIDFGIAKDLNKELTKIDSLKGKYPYMSPEQVAGEKLNRQTDIFSLGAVLWEILVGRKLFPGNSVSEVMKQVADCKIPSDVELDVVIPNKLDTICRLALAKNPSERYRNAGEMAEDLADFLQRADTHVLQRKLAEVVQEVFPEDFQRVRGLLKKYDSLSTDALPKANQATNATQATKPTSSNQRPPNFGELPTVIDPVLGPQANARRATRSGFSNPKPPPSQSPPVRSQKSFLWPVAIFIFVGSMVLYVSKSIFGPSSSTRISTPSHVADEPPALSTLLGSDHSGSQTSSSTIKPAEPPITGFAPPAPVATTPAPANPPQASTPPPTAPIPVVVKPPIDPPRPEIKTVDRPRIEVPIPQVVPTPTPRPISEPPRQVSLPPRPKKKRKPAQSAPPSPPIESIAYLTVFSDPGTAIFVNDKQVGVEIVNEMRVPAGQPITIKAVSGQSGAAKKKVLTFEPRSRNIIELSGKSGQK